MYKTADRKKSKSSCKSLSFLSKDLVFFFFFFLQKAHVHQKKNHLFLTRHYSFYCIFFTKHLLRFDGDAIWVI